MKSYAAVTLQHSMKIERISLAIDKPLLGRFDRPLAKRRLGNRSEAVRDLIRRRLVEEGAAQGTTEAVAA